MNVKTFISKGKYSKQTIHIFLLIYFNLKRYESNTEGFHPAASKLMSSTVRKSDLCKTFLNRIIGKWWPWSTYTLWWMDGILERWMRGACPSEPDRVAHPCSHSTMEDEATDCCKCEAHLDSIARSYWKKKYLSMNGTQHLKKKKRCIRASKAKITGHLHGPPWSLLFFWKLQVRWHPSS